MALQTYLVEHYRPGYTAERLEEWAARVRVAAAGIAHEGEPVRYLGSTIVPTDESLLCLLEAPSDDLVRAVYARAGLPFERLTAVISDDSPSKADGEATKGHSPITTGPRRQRRAHRPGGLMFTSRTHRRTVIAATVCALFASILTGVAPAGAETKAASTSAWLERGYPAYPTPERIDPAIAAALAQERYYSSYGEVERRTVPRSPHDTRPAHDTQPADDTPWLPIALSMAAALAIVAASATQARRLRIRRRAARVTA
jgi:hypothetical protein